VRETLQTADRIQGPDTVISNTYEAKHEGNIAFRKKLQKDRATGQNILAS
jgi:hypothetical protein